MKPVRLRRILPALAVGALLSTSWTWAAPPQRTAGTWDFVSQLWRWAAHWGIKNGLGIDPSGVPSPQSENGPTIDPHGAPTTGPKNGGSIDPNGGPTSLTQNGPGIDPNGRCLPGSPGCGS